MRSQGQSGVSKYMLDCQVHHHTSNAYYIIPLTDILQVMPQTSEYLVHVTV